MGMRNEINEALNAHSAWKSRFKDFLNGRASFDLKTIDATDQCHFGKWLANEGYRMVPSELYNEIQGVHKEFHQIAADILQKIKDKRFEEAREDISQNGALNQASLRLRDLLMKLSLREPSSVTSPAPKNGQPSSSPETDKQQSPDPDKAELPPTAEGFQNQKDDIKCLYTCLLHSS